MVDRCTDIERFDRRWFGKKSGFGGFRRAATGLLAKNAISFRISVD